MTDAVTYSVENQLALLTLNRPDKFNCLSTALIAGIERGLDKAEQDSSVRVVVISAAGKHFCTGADLEEVSGHRQDEVELNNFIGYGHDVMQKLEASRLPVVLALNGLCLAGGMELMMCADVVFAADDAKMGCQHAQYGLVPGWGGTQRLPRLVGLRRAMDLMYSARWLTAPEALDWGLVNYVVESGSLQGTVLEYAQTLSKRNPEGLAAMKQLARQGATLTVSDSLKFEQDIAVPALLSENVSEGLKAFEERREPVFK
ncbi:MAG: enoyl-CoA hydratase/isomerase family protein [Pseudomonadales bacterium]|nr:enoyl-CoA hydratase/isomerase family protein [Pseudomonadales bacterium]